MKLTVLGKYGPYPDMDGATSGYLVTKEKTKILLDCGAGVLARLLKLTDIQALSAIVISHTHFDHINDLNILYYLLEQYDKNGLYGRTFAGKPLKLYAPETIGELFKTSKYFDYQPINEKTKLKIDMLDVAFCQTVHPTETYACSVTHKEKRLVYTADARLTEQLRQFVVPCTVLLCDSGSNAETFTEKSVHMNPVQAATLAKEAGAKLVLTHILPLHDQCKLQQQAVAVWPETCVAEEFHEYEI